MMKKIFVLILGAFAACGALAVTCPISGTCSSNSNYKTVADNASCGDSSWVEVTNESLVISGDYTDGKGTFTYTNCGAN